MGFPSHLIPSNGLGVPDLLLCIPTTFQDLAHLYAFRQLAIYIGMPAHEIENLISWRPRPP
jgi:hypothetical protein